MNIVLALLVGVFCLPTDVSLEDSKHPDKKALTTLISQFVEAGDNRDGTVFKEILDDNFRLTINGFRGQPGVTIIDKSTYIDLMEGGRIGGDKRTFKVDHMNVKDNIAVAKVIIEGTTVVFTSYYQFIKNESGRWLLVGDMPYTESKK